MTAGRMAVLSDPEGAIFSVWEPKDHHGAQVVNEHGALNFNGLATRNVEQAKAFYGALFGWGVLDLGGAGLMWTLPGYGDHLEEKTPGIKEQVASMGGPDGFIDVVAMINPIPDSEPDTPPHWSVTFGVDDADSVAAKAAELGGDVIAGPFDAPWVRLAAIKDPQGAIFVASQFVPENAPAEG
jgi:predicted enzyme related to lactoylglutathione lyase